jgi:hypothetical protein
MQNLTGIKNALVMYLTISGLAINLIAIPKCLTGKAHISVSTKNFFISIDEEEME